MGDPEAPAVERRGGSKRSLLAQDRSRATRRKLVEAAMDLWTERGFETGIESTTAEEIATRAGVSKATFYFHFERKEQVLLEMGWLTARAVYEDALKALADGVSVDVVLMRLMDSLAARVAKAPRAAVRRSIHEGRSRLGDPVPHDQEHLRFQRSFSVVFTHAQSSGELPTGVSPVELGAMLDDLVTSAILTWAIEGGDLPSILRQRTAILLAGIRHADVVEPRPIRAGRARSTSTPARAR